MRQGIYAGVFLVCASATSGVLAQYTFTRVAETGIGWSSLDDAPVINEAGNVVFNGIRSGSGSGLYFHTAGGTTVRTMPMGESYWLDDSNHALASRRFSSPAGIFRGNGGAVTTIASNAGPLNAFGFVVATSNDSIVYQARYDDGRLGYFRTQSAAPVNNFTLICDAFSGSTGTVAPGISHNGTMVFVTTLNDGRRALSMTDVFGGENSQNVILSSGEAGLEQFVWAAVNDSQQVLFQATSNSAPFTDLYRYENGVVTVLARHTDPVWRNLSGMPQLNNDGRFLFHAELEGYDTQAKGIFDGPDPVNNVVIGPGSTLFGRTLVSAELAQSQGAMNEKGDFAFLYRYADGTRGIAIASVVPAPAAFVPLAVLVIAGRRRRRPRV